MVIKPYTGSFIILRLFVIGISDTLLILLNSLKSNCRVNYQKANLLNFVVKFLIFLCWIKNFRNTTSDQRSKSIEIDSFSCQEYQTGNQQRSQKLKKWINKNSVGRWCWNRHTHSAYHLFKAQRARRNHQQQRIRSLGAHQNRTTPNRVSGREYARTFRTWNLAGNQRIRLVHSRGHDHQKRRGTHHGWRVGIEYRGLFNQTGESQSNIPEREKDHREQGSHPQKEHRTLPAGISQSEHGHHGCALAQRRLAKDLPQADQWELALEKNNDSGINEIWSSKKPKPTSNSEFISKNYTGGSIHQTSRIRWCRRPCSRNGCSRYWANTRPPSWL